jgi:hypothetical protein
MSPAGRGTPVGSPHNLKEMPTSIMLTNTGHAPVPKQRLW